MLPSLGAAVLPSEASPAALDKSFSAQSLGRHCVEDILDELDPRPTNPCLFRQTVPQTSGLGRTQRSHRHPAPGGGQGQQLLALHHKPQQPSFLGLLLFVKQARTIPNCSDELLHVIRLPGHLGGSPF